MLCYQLIDKHGVNDTANGVGHFVAVSITHIRSGSESNWNCGMP